MTRHIKRGGKVWINVFPDKPVTQKPAETRMGSGKGNPEQWVAVVKPGRVLFELSGCPRADRRARRCASRSTSCRSRPASSCDRKRRRHGTKAAELRELNDDELDQRLAEAKDELFKLRFQHATGQLDNYRPHRRRRAGTSPACSTLLREREIAAAEADARSSSD